MKHRSFATSEVFFRFPPLINNQIINVQNVVELFGEKKISATYPNLDRCVLFMHLCSLSISREYTKVIPRKGLGHDIDQLEKRMETKQPAAKEEKKKGFSL